MPPGRRPRVEDAAAAAIFDVADIPRSRIESVFNCRAASKLSMTGSECPIRRFRVPLITPHRRDDLVADRKNAVEKA
jgi:hypothetical protein